MEPGRLVDIINAAKRQNGAKGMKISKNAVRIMAAILAGLMIVAAVAGTLIYVFAK